MTGFPTDPDATQKSPSTSATGPAPIRLPDEVARLQSDPAKRVGKYVVVKPLGAGGMGLVVKAYDTQLHRWIALKFMKAVSDETAQAYFIREAQLAARLNHPNIAQIFEVGSHENQPYIAMQFVDGQTLGAARKAMGIPQIVDAVRCVVEALQYAHEHKVIHRDLKPANVMVDAQGRVYVMDFGLAKEASVDGQSIGGSGIIVGTPNYMAPEQARGKADSRSDLYGAGAIFYELVTGRPPFTGESAADVLAQVVGQELVWPRRLNPSLPDELESVIIHALDKDASRRYQSAAQILEDLDAFSQGNPLTWARKPTSGYVLRTRIRKNPLPWVLAAVTLVAIAGGSAFGVVQMLRRAEDRTRLAQEAVAVQERQLAQQRLATLWLTVAEAKQEMRSGRLDATRARKALKELVADVSRFVETRPDMPQGYYIRARGEFYLGDYDRAEASLRKALALAEDFRPGWALLGMIQIQRSQEGIAEEDGSSAEASKREIAEALDALRKGWQPGREREEAARWGLVWSREDQVAGVIAEALRLRHVEGDSARAKRFLQEALFDYRSEEYILQIGFCSADAAEQLSHYDGAVELARGYDQALLNRGNKYLDLQAYDKAIDDYTRVIELREDHPLAFNNRANAKLSLGDLKGALADFRRAAELKPDMVIAWFNCGVVRAQLGQLEGAQADYTRAIEVRPAYGDAYLNRGGIKRLRNDLDGAMADFVKAAEYSPASAHMAYLNQGLVHRQKGDAAAAVAEFTRAIERSADYLPAYINRALSRGDTGDWEGAVADLSRAIALDPTNAEAHTNRAAARRQAGDHAGAAEDYTRVIELQGPSSDLLLERSLAREAAGDPQGSLSDLDTSIELDPRHGPSLNNRGLLRSALEDLDGALADFDAAIAIDPSIPGRWFNRAQLRMKVGDIAGAGTDLDRVIKLDRSHSGAYLNRGKIKRSLGDRDGAIVDFDRVLELEAGNWEALNLRGLAKLDKGNPAAAAADFQRSLALRPDATVHYNLGVAKAQTGEWKDAAAAFDAAAELNPGDPDIYHMRGIVRQRQNDPARALADFEQALALAPPDWPDRAAVAKLVADLKPATK